MATFEVDVEGATYEVDAPDENTAWKWANETHKQANQPIQPSSPSMMQQLGTQAGLTGRAALEGIGDVAGIIGNPIAAITGARRPSVIATDIANRMGLPTPQNDTQRLVNAAGRGVVGAGSMIGVGGALSQAPSALGKFGSLLAAQPVAQATSAGLGAGGAELARQSGSGVGGQLAAGIAGSLAPTLAAKAIPAIGRGVANVIGGVGTHTGGESLKQAAIAGMKGGKTGQMFKDNMRGNVPIEDALDDVKFNIQKMGEQKSNAYRQGMAQVSGDKSVLVFDGIDNAVDNANKMARFGNQVKNQKAADKIKEVADAVAEWKQLNPAEYHTPEGLDALKQKVGGILESVSFEEKTARSAVGGVYNSIKNEINKQAPTYAKTMKGYSEATERIREIERALSAGQKSTVDAGIRKLQSLTRNNASTNYGNRIDLAKELEQAGGQEFMPALAGQALNAWTPRGLGGAVAGGLGLGGYAVGGPGLAIPMLAAQSPRLMGEAAYATGKLSALAAKPLSPTVYRGLTDATLRSLLYGGMGTNQ